MNPITTLVARILLALLFIMAGIGKLSDVQSFTGYLVSGGLPAILAWPSILLEIVGGIAILVGYQTRITAPALAAFSVAAAVLYHFDPSNQLEMAMFMKNFAIAGGFLLLTVSGAGAYSIDAKTNGGRAAV